MYNFRFFPTENGFMLDFPARSAQNIANYSLTTDKMPALTACAWFKTKEQGNIFQYFRKNPRGKMLNVFVTVEGDLEFTLNGGPSQ